MSAKQKSSNKNMATDRKQIIGFMLSPEWIANPALADPFIADMADHGYTAAILFVRHMALNVRDPEVRDAVKTIAISVKKRGVKFVLDTDWMHWGERFVALRPEAAGGVIGSYQALAQSGYFEFHAAMPSVNGMILFERLAAVYKSGVKGHVLLSGNDFSYERQSGSFDLKIPGVLIRGKLSEPYSGPLTFYVIFKTFGLPDVSHPSYLAAQKEMLDQYRDVPLDGISWDEPGKGIGLMNYFKAGNGFLEFFKKTNGYDLLPDLIYLDHLDGSEKAAKIRCDYYRTLVEMNFIAQREHNEYAKQLFGKDILLGTHHTWSGLPSDLATGCMDYFYLGRVLNAAWTDGGWSFETRLSAFNLALADGLRHELGLRDAYYNDWTRLYPTVEEMRFANRHKMLYHVNNFLMDYSEFCEGHINFQFNSLKAEAKAEVRHMDDFDALIGNRAAWSDIACLHCWEGAAAAPKWMSRAMYTVNANIVLHLADRNIFPRIMGVESVRRAVVSQTAFTTGNLSYRAIIVPYAHAVPKDVYDKLMAMAEAGVAVIFIGPPPEFSAAGERLNMDFANRIGMKSFGIIDYQTAFAACGKLPGVNEWEPEMIEFIYPVEPATALTIRDAEGRIIHLRSTGYPLYYLPAADPREDLANLVETISRPFAESFCERTYLRFFSGEDHSSCVLLAVAKGRATDVPLTPDCVRMHTRPVRKHQELKALVRFSGGELVMRGGAWCAVRFENGQPAQIIGETKETRWNGQDISSIRSTFK